MEELCLSRWISALLRFGSWQQWRLQLPVLSIQILKSIVIGKEANSFNPFEKAGVSENRNEKGEKHSEQDGCVSP